MKHDEAMEKLRLQSGAWGLDLRRPQLKLLGRYAESLATHEQANVIGTKERGLIITDHILDSLSCLTLKGVRWEGRLVDVGTGGGLPGIPLAIACPEMHVTLLETTSKKVRFLETVLEKLELGNVELLEARVEEVGGDRKWRDSFDLSVIRAVASLPVVIEYCAPLIRTGGLLVAMKGNLQEEELATGRLAAPQLHMRLKGLHQVEYCPSLEAKARVLAVFEKTSHTPRAFPRRMGLAKRRPLGA